MDAAIAKPRRKRFQFSLRTLMIAVLVYGLLWVLTIKWGGARLAREYAENFTSYDVSFESDGTSMLISDERSFFWHAPNAIRGRATAPAPFILIWQWETKYDDKFTPQNDYDIYFWLMGFRHPIKQNPVPDFMHGFSPPY